MRKQSLFVFLAGGLLVVLLSACNANSGSDTNASASANNTVADTTSTTTTGSETTKPTLRETLLNESKPLQCQSNDDCVVKDVGSCCGYNPQCVHKDQATDPAAVKEQCAKDGRSSICGFQEPTGCECVNQQCKSIVANTNQ